MVLSFCVAQDRRLISTGGSLGRSRPPVGRPPTDVPTRSDRAASDVANLTHAMLRKPSPSKQRTPLVGRPTHTGSTPGSTVLYPVSRGHVVSFRCYPPVHRYACRVLAVGTALGWLLAVFRCLLRWIGWRSTACHPDNHWMGKQWDRFHHMSRNKCSQVGNPRVPSDQTTPALRSCCNSRAWY